MLVEDNTRRVDSMRARMREKIGPARSYLAVLLLSLGAFATSFALWAFVSYNVFPLFLCVILASAWFFGKPQGLFAVLLALMSLLTLVIVSFEPGSGWTPLLVWRLVLFTLFGVSITWMGDELRKAREQLTEKSAVESATQDRLVAILESISDAFFGVDNSWHIVYFNQKAIDLAGKSKDDIFSGKTIWELFPQSIGTFLYTEFHRAMDERKPRSFEAYYPVLDRHYHVRIYPTNEGMSTFFHDITARKKAEDAMHQSEERYRAFLKQTTEGVCRVELDEPISVQLGEDEQVRRFLAQGSIAECNDAMARMYGFQSADEMVGRRLTDLLARNDARNVEMMRSFVRNNYQADESELHELDRHGNDLYFANNMVGIVENGSLVRIWGTQRDISERKRLEEAQRRQASELERSNKDLEQFAYAVSHDLQEPLRMILNFSQILAKRYKGQLDADADEFLTLIETSATRLRALIADLLAYSHVVHSERVTKTSDCNAVMQWALTNLAMVISETEASITFDNLPSISGDDSQLLQLFQNLLANALKYRGESPPVIHVRVVERSDDWMFSFKDNGIGISPAQQERIFGIFKRIHGRKYEGTGVGLALCKRIVERHGGAIWVESDVGQGANFLFTLPKHANPLALSAQSRN